MPDSHPTDKPKTPSTPEPIPSPPLPNFRPPADKPRASTPPPVPSPPLPPLTTKPAPAAPPTPTEFKISGEAPPSTPAAKAAPQTPPSQTATPAAPTAKASPAAPPPPASPHQHTAPKPRSVAASRNSSPIKSPSAPGRTPATPRPASLQSLHVEEAPPEPAHITGEAAWRIWLDKAEPLAMWMFRIGAFAGALSLAFLLYAIFVGKIGQAAAPAPMIDYLKTATTVFHGAMVLLAVSTIMLAFDARAVGIGFAIAGVLLHFGTPWIFANHIGQTSATLAIVTGLRATGSSLMLLGVLKAAIDLMQWIMLLPERMKMRADVGVGRKAEAAQQRVARDANVFSPCWKLPFCRETIRKQCPAFLARKTCWKFGRGCYCDEEMISRIIRGESLEIIKAPTRLSKTGKAPCARCHIYLEHQGHKFKALSPLTLPVTAIIMYAVWPYWTKLFAAFSTSPVWDMLSFDPKRFAPDAIATTEVTSGGLPPEQVMQVATSLFGVLLGFFVLIYVAKFIEWFVYQAKL